MKLITLNTWGGRAGKEKLLSFLSNHKEDVDVFCFQEIWESSYGDLSGVKVGGIDFNESDVMIHGLQEISDLLSDFVPYFRPHHGDHYGLLMMVKKSISVSVEGEIFVHKFKGYVPEGDIGAHARNIQFITTELNNSKLTFINFHGLWNGKGKTDTEDRLNQSNKIKDFIKTLQGDVILCGDFNLNPETESIKIIEDIGLKNLIKDFNIETTRTSFYTKPEKFADYIFVSKNIEVEDFKVLPDEVSDHAALYLEF